MSEDAMDPRLFTTVLNNIQKILRYNYLDAFYKEKQVDLLSIPNTFFKETLPSLEFNSVGINAS